MKKLSLRFSKRAAKVKEAHEFDARRYWVALLCVTVFLLAVELVYFSWRFRQVAARLDAPATPSSETNAAAIGAMRRDIEAVEAAIETRTGKPVAAPSQNAGEVVQ